MVLHSRERSKQYALRLDQRSWAEWGSTAHLRAGFTSRYDVTRLVHYKGFELLMQARAREYAVKKWRRAWKVALIEARNPSWQDLIDELNN